MRSMPALTKVYVYTSGPLPLWIALAIIAVVVLGLLVLFVELRNR